MSATDQDLLSELAGMRKQLRTAALLPYIKAHSINQYAEELRDLGNAMSDLGGAVLHRVAEIDATYEATRTERDGAT